MLLVMNTNMRLFLYLPKETRPGPFSICLFDYWTKLSALVSESDLQLLCDNLFFLQNDLLKLVIMGAMKQGQGTCRTFLSFPVISANVPCTYHVHRYILRGVYAMKFWPRKYLYSIWQSCTLERTGLSWELSHQQGLT